MNREPIRLTDDLISQVLRSRSADPATGLLDDIVRAAEAMPQRRSLLGIAPVRLPRRTLLIVALALLLAAAGIAAAIGARFLDPDPPLRANGEIVAVRDGELVAFDPTDGARRSMDICSDCNLPSWSADGSLLAYLRAGSVVVRDMAAETEREVATCGGACSGLALSPDGSRVAYADGIAAHVRNLADGSELTFAPSNVIDVSWAPAGDQLLLGSRNRLHRVRTDGSETELLVGGSTTDVDPSSGPIYASWSPDGRRIAYVLDVPDASLDVPFDYQLWVMDAGGGGSHRLIWNAPNCCMRAWGGPSWSPDGMQISVVATAGDGGMYALWVVEADGSDATMVAGVSPERVAWRPRQ